MFPVDFGNEAVLRYTTPGDTVIDPFAGRGTAVFSAAVNGRRGLGIEVNPVGWVYAATKLAPVQARLVEQRIYELGRIASSYRAEADRLPAFFNLCFSATVRAFLVAARDGLNWRSSRIDRTVMALLLVYLHGKRSASLSNQMRQTKSMSPDYAVRWWEDRALQPPDIDPVEFMLSRLAWRYAAGLPAATPSRMYLGDSTAWLPRLARLVEVGAIPRVRLLLTSPPYYRLTNYHYDQWLRLWLLGGPPNALRTGGAHRGKFEHRERYQRLLIDVFSAAARMLSDDAVVYVRTGRQPITYDSTISALHQAFPTRQWIEELRPYQKPTQTALFGDREPKVGEVDLISVVSAADHPKLMDPCSCAPPSDLELDSSD